MTVHKAAGVDVAHNDTKLPVVSNSNIIITFKIITQIIAASTIPAHPRNTGGYGTTVAVK
jgi:hypothetical protein